MIEELKELLELKTKYYKYFSFEESLAAVKKDGWALQFVKEQTEEICLAAVEQYGWALKYVKEQTSEICLAAVQQNGWALEHVKEQTPEICLAAVKQNSDALKYVKEQTIENYLADIEEDRILENVKEKEQDEIMHLSEIEKDVMHVIRLRKKYDISLKINKTGIKIYMFQNDDCLGGK